MGATLNLTDIRSTKLRRNTSPHKTNTCVFFTRILTKMQRANYGHPAPATSPPLHHPVPQHVSTVPQLRSPPPPMSQQQQQSGYGNPYQPQAPPGAANAYGADGIPGWTDSIEAWNRIRRAKYQSICQLLRAQALLQRLKRICGQQVILGSVSLETRALVAQADTRSKRSGRMVHATEGRSE